MGNAIQANTNRKTYGQILMEVFFRRTLITIALLMVVLVFSIMLTLIFQSIPALKNSSLNFLWGRTWDPITNIYGGFPFFIGTLLTSFLALIISIPFSFSLAFYLGEYKSKGWISDTLKNIVELIAAVPSVIYGFWGLMVLVPLVRVLETKLGILPYGIGIFTASLILAIMIIPYGASLGREVIKMVPSNLKEAAYSLGATRFEVIKNVIFPYAKSGLFAGILLSLGRALGETMAVTMVIGNTNMLPTSIFGTGNTMASVIANEFTEADHTLYLAALIELGLFLFAITIVINLIGKRIIQRFTTE